MLVEKRRFEPTHLCMVSPLGVMSSEFRRDFWSRITRVAGLSYGVVSLILGLVIRLVTDRRTDRQTDGQTHDDS